MTTEMLIFTSVARRLEAGTYSPCVARIVSQPPPAIMPPPPRHYVAEIIGSALLGAFIALAFMV
jgi:hypothetical protein